MESLVHYKRLLLPHYTSDEADIKLARVKDCFRLLRELEAIDPARKRRYQEIGEKFKD